MELNLETIDNLINIMGQVKDLKRSGWIKREISNPESDGEHMFSTAFLVLVLSSHYQLDRCHCLELALTHDLAEIKSGDPTPGEKDEKSKYLDELAAITEISQILSMPQLIDWFEEFEKGESKEAQFVRCLDKLDTVLTAAYYDRNKRSEKSIWDEFSSYGVLKLLQMGNEPATDAVNIIRKIKC